MIEGVGPSTSRRDLITHIRYYRVLETTCLKYEDERNRIGSWRPLGNILSLDTLIAAT
jgi:hypothetical protein